MTIAKDDSVIEVTAEDEPYYPPLSVTAEMNEVSSSSAVVSKPTPRQNRCWTCGEIGHLSKDCPTTKGQVTAQTVKDEIAGWWDYSFRGRLPVQKGVASNIIKKVAAASSIAILKQQQRQNRRYPPNVTYTSTSTTGTTVVQKVVPGVQTPAVMSAATTPKQPRVPRPATPPKQVSYAKPVATTVTPTTTSQPVTTAARKPYTKAQAKKSQAGIPVTTTPPATATTSVISDNMASIQEIVDETLAGLGIIDDPNECEESEMEELPPEEEVEEVEVEEQ